MVAGPCAFVPDRAGFLDLARRGRLAFVYREVLADTDTPVSAYAKLGRGPYSFLLESVVGGDKWAAYSFVGVRPRAVDSGARRGRRGAACAPGDGDGFRVAERATVGRSAALRRRLPGQAVARACRPGCRASSAAPSAGWATTSSAASSGCRARSPTTSACPSSASRITDTVVVFDNLRGTVKVVAAGRRRRRRAIRARAYDDACARIDAVHGPAGARRRRRCARSSPPLARRRRPSPRSTVTRRDVRGGRAPRPGVHPGRRRVPGRAARSASRCRAAASIRSTSTARCA